MRCGIDGSPMRLLLQTTTFALYTCTASAHTVRTGEPAPQYKAEIRASRRATEKPLELCDYGACQEPKNNLGGTFCAEHHAKIRARERGKYKKRRGP